MQKHYKKKLYKKGRNLRKEEIEKGDQALWESEQYD